MGREHPWSRHYQHPWAERAGNRRLPAWVRVSCLAYSRHRANGHAVFRPGEIALILGVPTPDGPEPVKPMDKHNLQRAIRAAVGADWLALGSGTTCLIVPGHAITGGLGYATDPCPRHGQVGH